MKVFSIAHSFSRSNLTQTVARSQFKGTIRCFAESSTQNLKKTSLHKLHVDSGAKMVEFCGWDMPIQYPDGIMNSHLHTRSKAGLFDVSHMSQLKITGKDRIKFLEGLVVADLQNLPQGSSQLSVLTNENGGIIDDTIITNAGDYLYVVVNAGCADKDIAHLKKHLEKFNGDAKMEPIDRSLLAIQGPSAESIVAKLVKEDITKMPFMTSKEMSVDGIPCRVTRCGYTGEDGFEISVDHSQAVDLAKKLMASGDAKLVGLGARDSLRLEAGLNLYGHDIEQHTTPVEASLNWVIGKSRREKGGFLGDQKILEQLKNGAPIKRVGLIIEGSPAREGATIHDKKTDKEIGKITSGTFSPVLKQSIAMGYVESGYGKLKTEVNVKVRGKMNPATISKMPFVPSNYKRV